MSKMSAVASFNLFFGGSFVLDSMIAIIVPSTMHNVELDAETAAYYVNYAASKMSDIFGASSTVDQMGQWEGISEASKVVYSYYDSKEDVTVKFGQVQEIAYVLQHNLQQECIGIMFNGKLHLWDYQQHVAWKDAKYERIAAKNDEIKAYLAQVE